MSGPSPWLIRQIGRIGKGGSVLDLACGSGRNAAILSQRAGKIWAVDRDVSALSKLQGNYRGGARLLLWAQDVEHSGLPPALKVDAIIVFNFLHRPLFASLKQHLRPCGILLHETFHERNRAAHGRPRRRELCWAHGEAADFFGSQGYELLEVEDGVRCGQRYVTRLAARCPAIELNEDKRRS